MVKARIMKPDVAFAIDELLTALPDLRAVYLFGSAATDTLREPRWPSSRRRPCLATAPGMRNDAGSSTTSSPEGASMPDDVLLAKAAIVENCLRRIREVYADNPDHLFKDWTRPDSILLNLELWPRL
jgi:hypothetical protein